MKKGESHYLLKQARRNAKVRPRKERQKDKAEYAWKKMGNDEMGHQIY